MPREGPAAQERQVAVIENVAIEIAHAHARRRRAHEAIERLIEKRLRGAKLTWCVRLRPTTPFPWPGS